MFFLAGCSASEDCFPALEPRDDPSKTRLNLDQCWKHEDLIRYYTTNIGTQLVPYKLVMPLELVVPHQTDPSKLVFTGERFFTKAHIEERWRFLILEPSDRDKQSDVYESDVYNKDALTAGWPLGFVVDKRDERMSGRQEWQGEWLGPTCAACHTGQIEYTDKNNRKWKLRVAGGPTMADVNLFLQDLKNSLAVLHEDGVSGGAKFTQYKDRYVKKFGSPDPKDLLGEKDLLGTLKKVVGERTSWHKRNDPPPSLPHGYGRLDAFGVIYNEVIEMTGKKPVGVPRVDAPVSFPFLWDFSHHNQTQWNGAGPAMPLVVNVAGALGIFAKYDPDAGWFGFKDRSTIRLRALREMQGRIDRLRSPQWPKNILGPIDEIKADAGRALFQSKCLICHAVQERNKPLKHIKTAMIKIEENTEMDGDIALPVQTDSTMAANADHRRLKDPDGKNEKPVTEKMACVTFNIILNWSHPREVLSALRELASMLVNWGFPHNEPDDYKARPLDGIWATAPYLHNGSVPNLYELLLPSAKRTKQFCVGSREFDPTHVGFVMLNEADCKAHHLYWLDTGKDGNHNTGHEKPGYDVPTEEQIWQLVEYLKTL